MFDLPNYPILSFSQTLLFFVVVWLFDPRLADKPLSIELSIGTSGNSLEVICLCLCLCLCILAALWRWCALLEISQSQEQLFSCLSPPSKYKYEQHKNVSFDLLWLTISMVWNQFDVFISIQGNKSFESWKQNLVGFRLLMLHHF